MKAGWKTVKLGEACKIVNGATPSTSVEANWGGPHCWITPAEMGGLSDPYVGETRRTLTDVGLADCSASLLPTGSVILSSRAPIGHVIINTVPMATNQGCKSMIPRSDLDAKFLFYFIKANVPLLESLGTGATFKELSGGKLASVEIPLPPLAEQKRIVALLDEAFAGIDEGIANAKQKLSDAQSITDSHIHSIFTKPGPGWTKNVLCELCTFSSGNTPSKSNSGYWNGTIPWISGRDMKSTRLSDSHLHISKSAVEEYGTRVAEPGTLLVLVRGMGLAHGAQVAELTAPCAFNQDIRGIHANAGILPRYLLFALKYGINNGDSVLSSAAHGTLKIDSNELHSLPISFPNLKQQEGIVASIDALTVGSQSLAKNLGKQVAALGELRKAILTQAFAGRLTA